jgi:hypothetical protein
LADRVPALTVNLRVADHVPIHEQFRVPGPLNWRGGLLRMEISVCLNQEKIREIIAGTVQSCFITPEDK